MAMATDAVERQVSEILVASEQRKLTACLGLAKLPWFAETGYAASLEGPSLQIFPCI